MGNEQSSFYYLVIYSRVKNSRSLHRTFNVEPLYLQHENTGLAIDYMVKDKITYIQCAANEMQILKYF